MIKFEDFLDIQENEIKAKVECRIFLDLDEFGDNVIETSNSFIIPGIVDIYIPEKDTIIPIVLDYNINIIKQNEEIDDEGRYTFIYYPDDLIIKQEHKNDRDDIRTAISLLQGRFKYIKNPNTLINLLHTILGNTDLVHLELVIANMFRNEENEPVRFKGNYENKNNRVIGMIELGRQGSWLSSISYRNLSDNMKQALIKGEKAEKNPIEKLLEEDFD
jgi:hypothetical protein